MNQDFIYKYLNKKINKFNRTHLFYVNFDEILSKFNMLVFNGLSVYESLKIMSIYFYYLGKNMNIQYEKNIQIADIVFKHVLLSKFNDRKSNIQALFLI